MAGFLRAERLNGYLPTPCEDILNHVRQRVLLGDLEEYQMRQREAQLLLAKYGYNKAEFRAMMLNCEAINDLGGEVSLVDGKPLRDGEHYEYQTVESFFTEDGIINVPYMELATADGMVICRVYKNDKPFIDEMLAQDMAIGDPINERYLKEAEPGGLLEEYAGVIFAEYPLRNADVDVEAVIVNLERWAKAVVASEWASEEQKATAVAASEKIRRICNREPGVSTK